MLFRDEAAGVDTPDNPDESDKMAAYADKVFDYVPAPTQYMNTVTTAYTEALQPSNRYWTMLPNDFGKNHCCR